MSMPALVEATRGPIVESRHRGSLVIAHTDGGVMLEIGATQTPVYPRSSIKLAQALALVETGAADAFGFSDYELALACASHNGEARHVAAVAATLERLGLDADVLACGARWPYQHDDVADLIRAGAVPTRITNECSGKHAGMLAVALHQGFDPQGYGRPDHPLQRAIAEILSDVFDTPLDEAPCGVDGCSIPTRAVPLRALACGFARFFGGPELSLERRAAADRLFRACAAEPHAVAGVNRLDTEVMAHFGASVFLKGGAEGVYMVALPQLRVAAAVKIEDGASRAAQVVASAIVARFAVHSSADDTFMESRVYPDVTNARGDVVGRLQPTQDLRQALTTFG